MRVPVIWGPVQRQHAKLYYTLQALRRPDLHTKVFDAIHQQGLALSARNEVEARAMQFAFLNREGVTEKEFDAAYDSMSVASNMLRAEEFTQEIRGGERSGHDRERQIHHQRERGRQRGQTARAGQ